VAGNVFLGAPLEEQDSSDEETRSKRFWNSKFFRPFDDFLKDTVRNTRIIFNNMISEIATSTKQGFQNTVESNL
jgi:hypothetical protein